ncbi:MAG: GNAT family N-acetyltransferase [Hominenteromicrobium sp.]
MILRKYESADCAAMAALFYDTVHTVNARDYTPAQLDVWATGHVDLDAWNRSFLDHFTVVADEGGTIIGFGDIDGTGYLDRLYVHKDYQGRGTASAICDALEAHAAGKAVTTHASITAKPFFKRRGYRVIRAQQVERGGLLLTNFVMRLSRG